MALRLTGTTSSSSGVATPAPGFHLDVRARTLLADGDLDGYRALAQECEAIADPQRRYQAEVGLTEQGLLAVDRVTGPAQARVLAAVADVVLRALERAPAEPVLLNYAGVACYELWALDAAQTLFRAARRLDPGLANLEGNLAEVGKRKRAPRPARPLHAAVPGLARRATAVAGRARPQTGLTISLCMIVRDEEAMLGQCLASAAPAVDEMIVVDTGSTDRTVEIARSFGARVIEHPWSGDFAQARNVSFEAASGDWLLYLDADEMLAEGGAQRLREYASHTWREALYLVETSHTGELGGGTAVNHNALRMLRNRPGYRFEGRIHEQISHTLPTWAPGRIGMTSVRIEHYGYLGEVRDDKEKFQRNVELLRRQEAENGPSAFLHYNLGCEYGAAGEFATAAAQFAAAWTMLEQEGRITSTEFAPAVVAGLVRTLHATGDATTAQARARQGLALFPDFTDLVWEQACAARQAGDEARALELYDRCLELGDAPARYAGLVGTGTYLPRAAQATLALAGGDAARARELLVWCVTHHPTYLAVASAYVTAGLRCGVAGADLVSELERGLSGITPALRHAIATALQRGGAASEAATQYRLVLAQPAATELHPAAHAALAELALARGAFDEAARHAAAVADDDPRAALACRIATCAALARGDGAGARRALHQAGTVRLPPAERDAFAAWVAVVEGEIPEPVAVAGVPLLGALMELMLGAGAGEAFAQLRGLVESSPLPERDRRQLIAEAHLRHGHLAEAAAQWMAVCERRPDAPALLGLAQVAAGHGMPDDAVTFATGALELDPDCAPARALLEALGAPAQAVPAAASGPLDR